MEWEEPLVGAAKASYGHSMLRYAVSIRLITPTKAISYVIGFCTYYITA